MSMDELLFVLGAPDPEMEQIEWLLRETGVRRIYAMVDDAKAPGGQRPTAASAQASTRMN